MAFILRYWRILESGLKVEHFTLRRKIDYLSCGEDLNKHFTYLLPETVLIIICKLVRPDKLMINLITNLMIKLMINYNLDKFQFCPPILPDLHNDDVTIILYLLY